MCVDVIQITSIVLVDCARKHVCDCFYTYIVVELYHVLKGSNSKLFTVDIFLLLIFSALFTKLLYHLVYLEKKSNQQYSRTKLVNFMTFYECISIEIG